MIQLVATRKVLGAIFAVVHKHSAKMNILNVFSQVTSVRANFAAQGASVTLGTILHNVVIQLLRVLPCKNQLQSLWIFIVFKSAQKLLLLHYTMVIQHSHSWKRSLGNLPTHSHHMVVQFGFCVKYLLAIFAWVSKWTRKVKALNMFSQIVPMISSFATQCTSVEFETILSRDLFNVLVQLLVLMSACKHQQVNNYLRRRSGKAHRSLSNWTAWLWADMIVKWSSSWISGIMTRTEEEPGDLFVTLDVFIEQVSCWKSHFTEFTLMWEWASKMDVLNMHPQVTSGCSSFSTNRTTVHIWSHLWISHDILIQELVATCNSNLCWFTLKKKPWHSSHTLSSHGCSVWFLCQIPLGNICTSIWMTQGSEGSPRVCEGSRDHCRSFHKLCICELWVQPLDV